MSSPTPVEQAAALDSGAVNEVVEELAVDLLTPAPENPRRNVGDIEELVASIRAAGILEPLAEG